MGRLGVEDMLEHGTVEQALTWHLTSNHFPPIPVAIVPVAKRAILYANQGRWDSLLTLPPGMTWRGHTRAPVSACVDAWHLEAFLTREDDDE